MAFGKMIMTRNCKDATSLPEWYVGASDLAQLQGVSMVKGAERILFAGRARGSFFQASRTINCARPGRREAQLFSVCGRIYS